MGIPTIDPRSSLQLVDDEFLFSMVRFRADVAKYAVLPGIIAELEAFEQQWREIVQQERTLSAAVFHAQARVERADEALDQLSDGIAAAITLDLRAKNKKRNAPEYTRYYGSKSPSDFRKPI